MFDYILIRDEKAANVHGGTFTSGAWQPRDLTVKVSDLGGHATLAANRVTLAPGIYLVKAKCPANATGAHYARLQNITDGTTLILGTTENTPTTVTNMTCSWMIGRITLFIPTVIEIQHRCTTTRASDGFGVRCNADPTRVEIYTVLELIKLI